MSHLLICTEACMACCFIVLVIRGRMVNSTCEDALQDALQWLLGFTFFVLEGLSIICQRVLLGLEIRLAPVQSC